LIEKGIFKNTYSNLFDSYKEAEQSTGNASRPGSPMGRSAEPIPISSPHNLKIIPGDQSQEEMIKETKHGLLVGRLWYTYAVNPIKGDFSCTARSGIRIIENGEIKGPGKSVRIIHNLPTMMKNISAKISKNNSQSANNDEKYFSHRKQSKKCHPMGISPINHPIDKGRERLS
jgi:PmbA protein